MLKNKNGLLVCFAAYLLFVCASVVGATHIMPLGDSITRGAGSDPIDNGYRRPLYFKLIDDGYDFDFVGSYQHGSPDFDRDHQGKYGIEAHSIALEIHQHLQDNPCQVVLLHIGTNDLRDAVEADIPGIVNDVEDILETIDVFDTNITVILARIINLEHHVCPNSSLTSTFNEQLQTMAESRIATKGDKIIIVDMECGAGIDYAGEMYDTYHPNNDGYEKIAAVWHDTLVQVLPSPSDPLNTWTPRSSGFSYGLYAAAYGNGIFVAAGYLGGILTSPDGIVWTPRYSGASESFMGIRYLNDRFIAVGEKGTLVTSSDGLTWTPRTSGIINGLQDVAYGNKIYVCVGRGGAILTSTNATSWTPTTSGTTDTLRGVAYGNGIFVAVGNEGRILTSFNGNIWTPRSCGTVSTFNKVAYGNGIFVAVGNDLAIFTSSNGISWIKRSSGDANRLFGLAYGNDTFVAVGETGTILTSSDGTSWMGRPTESANNIIGAAYGHNSFLAVGINGTILQSTFQACDGDFDGDRDVDGSDLATFAADFGRTDCSGPPPCEGDFDGDGDVDGSDLATFAADFGRTDCP